MTRFLISSAALLIGLCLISVSPAGAAGLYDDDAKATTRDLNSQDYWWTKFDMMMLDMALKQHQPEGRIGLELASTDRRLDDLIKQYPKHEQLKEWKKKVGEIIAKIDPNANRGDSFKPGCPWEEANFAQLWVNLHWASMMIEQKDYDHALGLMQNVRQNYEIMMKPDRMKDYPDDLRKWVEDNKPVVDKMYKDLKEKMRH